MYQRATTERAPAPIDAAARLAALASSAPAAADLIDALAEALLELPLTSEVHVRRWPDAAAFGFAAAYWAGRSRSYLAASWDSGALREAVAGHRPVATDDPAALPAGLLGRLTPSTPIAILPLGADEEPWGVAAVTTRTAHPLSEAALEAMATLGAIAGLGLGRPGELALTETPGVTGGALASPLAEEVSRARRHGSGVTLLVIEIEQLSRRGAAPDALARLAQAVEQTLRDEFRDFDRVGRLGDDQFGVVLPGLSDDVDRAAARRAIHRLKALGLEFPGQGEPVGVVVAVADWRAGESPVAFLERAMSLVARSETDFRGALDNQAAPTPNLPGGC